MHSEYAVEPEAIAASWETFKDLIDRFGADKGRLISDFPGGKWKGNVMEAAKAADIGEAKISTIEVYLQDRSKFANFGRNYDFKHSWINNTLREHGNKPFRAIICVSNAINCDEAVHPGSCMEKNPFIDTPRSRLVERTPDKIAESLLTIAKMAKEIDMVDPYFSIKCDIEPNQDYFSPLKELILKLEKAAVSPKLIRVHYSKCKQPVDNIGTENIKKFLPKGYRLKLYRWKQIKGGEHFHDRYFLTDIGGIFVGAGLSATKSAQTANFLLLDYCHSQELRSRFSAGANVYKQVGKHIRIDSD